MTLTGILKAYWRIIQIMTFRYGLFLNGINLAQKCEFVSLICWFTKSKQTWFPWCFMPFGTIQHLNTQSTVLTNSSVLVASVVFGKRWQPQQNLLNSFLSPVCLLVSLNAEVLVVVVVVGCVQGSWSQVSTFSCYWHCLPLTQNVSKGYQNNFKNLCYDTD